MPDPIEPPEIDPNSLADQQRQSSDDIDDHAGNQRDEGIAEQSNHPGSTYDTIPTNFEPCIDDIRVAFNFVNELKKASLDSPLEPLDPEIIHRLRVPIEEVITLDNPDHRLSLDIFLGITNASEETYNAIRTAVLRRYPESEILSYFKVKRLVRDLSGVAPIYRDMCINSCVGFTGPFSKLEVCPSCGEMRFHPVKENSKKALKSRKQFCTIPLGPQLQALFRSPEGAQKMGYRKEYTRRVLDELQQFAGVKQSAYTDFFDGTDYLKAVLEGRIKDGDVTLLLSIDGAQLYRYKASDCWIYIWIILDMSPKGQYKKVAVHPGGFIPGPNKPKYMDSFVFPGLFHLAALQKEGLRIWNAETQTVFVSHPFLALSSADGPAMACLTGFVGHHGRVHCRFYCPIIGRHKPGGSHYYPVRFRPDNYNEPGCNHDDVDLTELMQNFTSEEASRRYNQNLVRVIQSPNKSQYEKIV